MSDERRAPVRIRRGRMDDVPHLQPIERAATLRFRDHEAFEAFWALDFSPALFAHEVARGSLWVATLGDDDTPVGLAFTTEIDGNAHLDEIDVHPDASGQGVGSALLEHVSAVARAQGYPAITLSTLEDVPWNAPFYAKRGFAIVPLAELTPGYIDLLEGEARSGFPMHLRVIMRRDL
jgi:4-diphosphocytidyl-2-C-methyl-D-erythritol kinase